MQESIFPYDLLTDPDGTHGLSTSSPPLCPKLRRAFRKVVRKVKLAGFLTFRVDHYHGTLTTMELKRRCFPELGRCTVGEGELE